jgi:hypothetical protein
VVISDFIIAKGDMADRVVQTDEAIMLFSAGGFQSCGGGTNLADWIGELFICCQYQLYQSERRRRSVNDENGTGKSCKLP